MNSTISSYKPIGAAPWGQFLGGGSGRLVYKGVKLRGLWISEKKEILRKLIGVDYKAPEWRRMYSI